MKNSLKVSLKNFPSVCDVKVGAGVGVGWYSERMNNNYSDTKRLADTLTVPATTLTEILTEKLRTVDQVTE